LDGRPLPLSPKEFDLLAYMASRAGQVVSKRELLAEVWRSPYSQADKTVGRARVLAAPQAARERQGAPLPCNTIRGVGLRMDAPRVVKPWRGRLTGVVAVLLGVSFWLLDG